MIPDAVPLRIHRLPPLLANQIAAGEVVERPASVVKELVENALDAGATRVRVTVARGGLELIRVVDDGHGIHPGDLALALDRHATSKIRTPADLAAIRSLGFRGEALPSIASVAGLRLVSRIAAEPMGRELISIPGAPLAAPRPAAHPVGTTVEVTGLFHTVPARRRFLRSEQTEYLHVLDIARRLALSRPALDLRLEHDGRDVLHATLAAEPLRRVRDILGRTVETAVRPVQSRAGAMALGGWVAAPAFHRSQSDHQYFFLNGRMVRDRLLAHAVRVAYADAIPAGRFPVWILYLELDPAATDVNVHPTKHEVRFRHARDVHDFVQAAVRDAIAVDRVPAAPAVADAAGSWPLRPVTPWPAHDPVPAWRRAVAPASSRAGAVPAPGATPALLVAGRYLVRNRADAAEIVDGLVLCRLWCRAQLARQVAGGGVPRRPLLVPVEIPVTPVAAEIVLSRTALLVPWGWTLDRAGAAALVVREFPAALVLAPLVPLVHALVPVWMQEALPALAEMPGVVAAALPVHTPAGAGPDALLGMAADLGDDTPWRRIDSTDLARLAGAADA